MTTVTTGDSQFNQGENEGNIQLGLARATCRLAANAMGPSGQCGARATSYVSTSEAMRRSSLIPPQWAI